MSMQRFTWFLLGGLDGMNGLHEALDVGHLEAALVRCIIPRHCPVAWSVSSRDQLDPI